ncbi:glycosyltransferase [Microbacterium lacus]|uniref:D-inositol 3-phosphate glycosyltransferase n=1 Tax=Microbacterium lacus TaxID=415217 RepID=A0ABN2GB81_9MICO
MIQTVLGQPAVFRITNDSDVLSEFSLRERRLLVGALNFHALMAPGRDLIVHGYDGDWTTLPRTTDDATFDGMSRQFRRRVFTIGAASEISPSSGEGAEASAMARALAAGAVRHVHVSRDEVLDFDPPRDQSTSVVRRALRAVRARTPLLYDEARDVELLRHRRAITHPAQRRRFAEEFSPGGIHEDGELVPATRPPAQAPRAIVIGMHWFELGGAERWAFETVKLVRDAGFLPIVLTNRDSHHPWIGRPELDGALLIPFSEPTVRSQTPGVEELLSAILRTFDVRGIVVHHNQWLYDRLHWVAMSRPEIPIIDSTHIVEYRGGGFPHSSVRVEDVITRHHVISPTLRHWMVETQGVAAEKVVMAPLAGLTVQSVEPTFRSRGESEPFTVAFVGRMARQKAPEVFLAMAHRLRSDQAPLRFIMHGDGELSSWADDLIAAYSLQGIVERRDSDVPVEHTLAEAHVLVVTSHNEGLTLTTLEAISHGVPVISTDVGAQSDIIPSRALVSRNVHLAVRQAARKVAWLAGDESAREELWRDERHAEQKLLSATPASEWFTQEVGSW